MAHFTAMLSILQESESSPTRSIGGCLTFIRGLGKRGKHSFLTEVTLFSASECGTLYRYTLSFRLTLIVNSLRSGTDLCKILSSNATIVEKQSENMLQNGTTDFL